MQMMYLSLCTPYCQGDEILLIENAYNIDEWPVQYLIYRDTGDSIVQCHTEYRVFAVVSPTLMMML